MSSEFIHDPDAVEDYAVNWAAWLAEGDSLATKLVFVESGDVTVDSSTLDGAIVTAWISGGTVDTDAQVTYRVTTTQGRTDDRTIALLVRSE